MFTRDKHRRSNVLVGRTVSVSRKRDVRRSAHRDRLLYLRCWTFSALICSTILGILFSVLAASADTLTYRNRRQLSGTVIGVTATNVLLSGKPPVRVRDLSLITFAHSSVVAQSQGLLLTDGSRLSGTVHKHGKTNVTFRATSLGPLALPLAQVAAIYYTRDFAPGSLQMPPKGHILVMLKTGTAKQGKFFASSASTLILRTKKGLKKIAVQDMAYVSFRLAARRPGIILRNGDRLNMTPSWQKSGVTFTLAKRTTTLALRALQGIDFTGKIMNLKKQTKK